MISTKESFACMIILVLHILGIEIKNILCSFELFLFKILLQPCKMYLYKSNSRY